MPTIPEIPGWLGGFLAGALLVYLGHSLAYCYQRRRDRMERLRDRYADFFGIASVDVERAKSVESALVFKPNTNDDHFQAWSAGFARLEDKRHHHRLEMARLSFQIRLLEKDERLLNKLDEVRTHQPVFNVIGACEGELFSKNFDIHRNAIAQYSKDVEELCSEVIKRYRR